MQTMQIVKRAFGMYALSHTNRNDDRYKRPRLSMGITDPIFPSGIIPNKGILTLPPESDDYANAMDTGYQASDILQRVMAPRSSMPLQMLPRHGEIAVMRREQDAVGTNGRAKLSGARHAEFQVFTCGNGVDKDYPMRVAGIMTNADRPGDEGNKDNWMGLDCAGTKSTFNTGPDDFAPGDTAIVGLPWLIDQGDGVLVPGVTIPGEPKDKALFGVYRLRWNTVHEAVKSAKDELAALYEEGDAWAHANIEDSQRSREYILNKLNVTDGLRHDMPLFDYAVIHAHMHHLKKFFTSDFKNGRALLSSSKAKTAVVLVNQFLEALQAIEDEEYAVLKKYDSDIGADYDYDKQPLRAYEPLADTASWEECLARYHELLPEAEELKEIKIDRMHDYVRARILGRVLSPSLSGQQLDVLLGVTG